MRFLFVDKILELLPAQYVRGIKHITSDDPYLCADEQGQLCFVPSFMGEALGQLAAWNVMMSQDFKRRPVAGIASKACLYRPAYVGETLLLESFIDALDDTVVQYHSRARVGDDIVFTIDGALGPLLPMQDFIDEHEVRQQFSAIYQPNDSLPSVTFPTTDANNKATPTCVSLEFDRVVDCVPGLSMSAEKDIIPSASYFPDHFPRKPVLPMTVLLECKLNLIQAFLARSHFTRSYRMTEMRKIKMSEFVHPGDIVMCHLTVKQCDEHELILNCRSEVNGKRVCIVDVVMQ